jgi:hypothetical protein
MRPEEEEAEAEEEEARTGLPDGVGDTTATYDT